MNRQAKKRLFSLLLCICFIAGSLLAAVFVIEHAVHDCDGHGCSVCAQIHSAEKLLEQLYMAAVCAAFALAGLSAAAYAFRLILQHVSLITPITQKIRMNN